MIRRSPIGTLAKLATTLARPEMERRVYWRKLIGCDHWALILITRSKPDEKPAPASPVSGVPAGTPASTETLA